MISPRHCIYSEHMHQAPGYFTIAFLGTENVIYWRTNMENVFLTQDISLGILNEDLPDSVGFLRVLPTNYTNYLPSKGWSTVQGIGRNQDARRFGQPMKLGAMEVTWSTNHTALSGLSTNWNVALRGGCSSNPETLLIGNELVLVSHNHHASDGPNHASHIEGINQKLHYLSTNNMAVSDYQLTVFALTDWPAMQ